VGPDGARVAFELDRFELAGGDRLEVTGRWFGVRGLRFVRPSLTVQTADGERNLLALLEHKPWAAEEGESWVAAFPWEGDSPDPSEAELSVAPSVVVALTGEPDGETAAARARPSLRNRLDSERQRVRHLESEVAWLREEREALVADRDRAQRELAGERERTREEIEQLRAHEAKEKERIREEGRGEQERAASRREEAERERDAARAGLEAAMAERDGEVAARVRVERERDEALRERDQALRERDAAVQARDEALATTRSALAERDAALGRGSGFPAISAADLARQPHAPRISAPPDWTARAVAFAAIGFLLLLVLILLLIL
jgi:hypothetical protein